MKTIGLMALGSLVAGTIAFAAPSFASPLPVAPTIGADTGITQVKSKHRYRHYHRRHHHRWGWRRGHRFVIGGPNPSGCYYNDGGGRYASCSAGGFR